MLTGFDAPPLHTLYLDRPLKGALLMQTLARVNRTFRGKQDGLLVAYAPLAENLHKALAEYTPARPGEQAARPQHRRGRRPDQGAARPARRPARGLRLAQRLPRSGPQGRQDGIRLRRDSARSTTCATRPRPATSARRRRGRRRWLSGIPTPVEPARPRVGALRGAPRRSRTCAPRAQFYEEVRVWMAKFDAEDRRVARRADPRGHPAAARRSSSPTAPRPARCSTSTRPRGCRKPEPHGPRARSSSRKAQDAHEPAPGDRGAARPRRQGVGQGDRRQHAPPAGVLRPDRRADAEVHQPAAHLRRGHRRARRAGQGRRGRGVARCAVHARR